LLGQVDEVDDRSPISWRMLASGRIRPTASRSSLALTERLASERVFTELGGVSPAATYGAIDTLLVDVDHTIRGRVDDSSVISFDGADDGPGGGPCAALLRSPTG
jgi:hypothetical protein